MKTLLAALFVFVGLLAGNFFIFSKFPSISSGWTAFLSCVIFLILVVFVLRLFNPRNSKTQDKVIFDSEQITRILQNGKTESVRWNDLQEVGILTNDRGPWTDDLFWILAGKDKESGCIIPSEAVDLKELLSRLQQLPNFDNKTVIEAMGTTSNAKFICWKNDKLESNLNSK